MKKTILGVINQTYGYENIQLIVTDDCSTDDIFKKCEDWFLIIKLPLDMIQITNKIKLFNKLNITAVLFSVCLFILSKPYFVWDANLFNKLILFLIIFIALLEIRRPSKSDLFTIPLFVFYIIYVSYSDSANILGYIGNFSLIFILLIRKDKSLLYLKYFKYIFCISLLLSLITYLLIVFLNFNLPYNLISPLNVGKGIKYFQYPFLVSEGPLNISYLNIRFSGMFDEPGVVGSIVIILLFADGFNLRSKQNIILFIAGIFSFSLYFYVSIAAYFIYLANYKIRLLIISLFFLLYFVTSKNEIVNIFVWDRLAIEDGRLKGDNRSTEKLDVSYQNILNSNELLWGKGKNYAFEFGEGASSYKMTIVSYGLVFIIIVILAFLLYAYYNIRQSKYFIGYLFLFLGMLYQRSGFIIELHNFFLFIACIYAINKLGAEELYTSKKNTYIPFKV